ncbi:MAG TPA: hypothetical protein VNA25_25595 [Phycisphaerae bacterium]|nr:hypothetical protein [Phycisphaerae bacterium]
MDAIGLAFLLILALLIARRVWHWRRCRQRVHDWARENGYSVISLCNGTGGWDLFPSRPWRVFFRHLVFAADLQDDEGGQFSVEIVFSWWSTRMDVRRV